MDIDNVGAEAHERREAACHGVRDVVELEVEEDVLPLLLQPLHDVRADAVEELHADFVIRDGVAEGFHKTFHILHRVDVQSDNQAVIGHLQAPLFLRRSCFG